MPWNVLLLFSPWLSHSPSHHLTLSLPLLSLSLSLYLYVSNKLCISCEQQLFLEIRFITVSTGKLAYYTDRYTRETLYTSLVLKRHVCASRRRHSQNTIISKLVYCLFTRSVGMIIDFRYLYLRHSFRPEARTRRNNARCILLFLYLPRWHIPCGGCRLTRPSIIFYVQFTTSNIIKK